jgi:hypothetical protein
MPDSDKDGLSDELEVRLGTDPHDKDTDHDGIMDGAEVRLGTDPKNFDTDGDGWSDGGEIAQHRNPLHADAPPAYGRDHPLKPTADDPDADGLTDMQEHMLGTNPNDPDTDGDGIGDWVESIRGTDPTKADPLPKLDGTSGSSTPPGATGATGTDPSGSGSTGPFPPDPSIDPNVELLGASARNAFLDAAKAQIGDPYKFGAEADPNDPNPKAFDSSELVQWAASQAGVQIPDGSWKQYQYLHDKGMDMSVQDALHTPGALLFGFSSDPLASSDRPARAYVAISLGNGKVLDVSERAGVVKEMDPGNFYTYAAGIPQMMEDLDSDGDQMWDVDERVMGTNPFDPSDGPYAPKSGTDTTGDTPTPADDAPGGAANAGGGAAGDASGDAAGGGTATDPVLDGPVTQPYQVDPSLPAPDATAPDPTTAPDPAPVDTTAPDSAPADPTAPDPATADPTAPDPTVPDPMASDPMASDPMASDPMASDDTSALSDA